MNFINLLRAAAAYDTEPMKGNIERLTDFDAYHCLLAGSAGISIKLQEEYKSLPTEYVKWLKLCNGGLLFDTVLLSYEGYDKALEPEFDTYDDMNSPDALGAFGLPEGYLVFAMRSYGDPICFNMKEKDGKVYLWDIDSGEFTDIWNSFADWITEEIDDGIRLIADGALEPLDIKLDGEGNE